MDRPSRIAVIYNADYDEQEGLDVSSVAASARALSDALVANGYAVELTGVHGVEVLGVLEKLRADQPDLVFNLCESMAGDVCNEPTFAGLLDVFKIPYSGADLLGLACCLHKFRSKDILIANGIDTPAYRCLRAPADLVDPAIETLDYPYFLKLSHEDASVGITEANLVRTPAALRARAAQLFAEHAQDVIAERYIEGREINVTVIGTDPDLQTLPLHEIDFSAMPKDRPRIVSYAAKWDENHVDYVGTKPVPLRDGSPELVARVESVAKAAYAAHRLRDYGRVDLRVDATGRPWVIDVNPNCDLSPDAGVARAARFAGMDYPGLIEMVVLAAWRRITATGPSGSS